MSEFLTKCWFAKSPEVSRTRRTLALMLGGVVCALSAGCHHRAYTDVYVENMAAEIRDLEDQLYEYDYQYKLLEQELDVLRAEHHSLQPNLAPTPAPMESAPQALEFQSPDFIVPDPAVGGAEPEVLDTPSILEGSPTLPDSAIDPIEVPGQGSGGLQPSGSADDVLPPLDDGGGAPNPFPGGAPGDGAGVDSGTRSQPTSFEEFQLGPEELVPPSIEPGIPMPPPTVFRGDRVDNESVDNALERNLSRVEVPAQLASQALVHEPATLSPARAQTNDQRVVEMAFHPSYSRAANFDDDQDDDGLLLLLQPLNEAGEMVPVAADLFVGVLDPSRPEGDQWISRRKYTANEVKAKLKPIGTQQGIHLTLPWNGPDPGADRVVVFVYYTFPDDRTVVGEKTIFVNNKHGGRTVWAPRGSEADPSGSPVRVASHEQGDASTRVVRPAASIDSQPAPVPR